jgi:hypothetical protein
MNHPSASPRRGLLFAITQRCNDRQKQSHAAPLGQTMEALNQEANVSDTTSSSAAIAAIHLDQFTRSVKFWLSEFDRYGDSASVRNLAYAIGRHDGCFETLSSIDASLITPERKEAHDLFQSVWSNL